MIVTVDEAIPTQELLLRAERRLEGGELELARRDFEVLLGAHHDRSVEARVRLGYARVLEAQGHLEEAVDQLELRIALVDDAHADSAKLELMRPLILLERPSEASTLGRSIEKRRLSSPERIILEASDALSLAAQGEADRAEAALAPAWAALEVQGEAGEPRAALPAALVAFAAGEVAALRARGIAFDPVPEDVRMVLEARCRHMVSAQSAYADAMRLERGYLRLLAGGRIAQLYLELHHDILTAPLPAGFGPADTRAVAEGALLLRYDVLLQKAEQMLRITLSGTAESAATSQVRRRVELELEKLTLERAAYAKKLDDLAVSRDDLGRVLDSLGPPLDSDSASASGSR